MFRKHFEHICVEVLKYLLNLDHYWAYQLYSTAGLRIRIMQLWVLWIIQQAILHIQQIQLPVVRWENIFEKVTPDDTYAFLHLDRFKKQYPKKEAWGKYNILYP